MELKTRKPELKKIIIEIIVVCVLASIIGLVYNWRNPDGLPMIYRETVINKTSDDDLFGDTKKSLLTSPEDVSQNDESDNIEVIDTTAVDSQDLVPDKDSVVTDDVKVETTETVEEKEAAPVDVAVENIEEAAESDEPEMDDEGHIVAEYTDVTYDQVLRMIDNPDFLLIDARREEVWEEGRIGNAINIFPYDSEEVVFEKCIALPTDKKLVVYCEGGDCDSSHLLVEMLIGYAFENVYIYTGGWDDWVAKQGE
jgi:rhodanese-related sulfurtransferase